VHPQWLRTAKPRAGEWQLAAGRYKALYVAPSKALVQERVADWAARLAHLGVRVLECTGDSDDSNEAADIAHADVIATTPCAPLRSHMLWCTAALRLEL
jgi:replicative superfamily II helicase